MTFFSFRNKFKIKIQKKKPYYPGKIRKSKKKKTKNFIASNCYGYFLQFDTKICLFHSFHFIFFPFAFKLFLFIALRLNSVQFFQRSDDDGRFLSTFHGSRPGVATQTHGQIKDRNENSREEEDHVEKSLLIDGKFT